MSTNYSKHAKYWDWDEYDNSEIYEFWLKMSAKYGHKILSGMCAIGQAAAYMAQKDCVVTALDYTEEMIAEGKKRFGDMENLEFIKTNIMDFTLPKHDYDFCFISSADVHLLPSLKAVKKALLKINDHLRTGSGLGLELWYPPENSFSSPLQRYNPRVPRKDGVFIWKESESEYNSETKLQKIHQVVHIETDGKETAFDHFVNLQLYDKEVIFDLFALCGFEVVGQYSDFQFNYSDNENENIYVELRKKEF